MITAESLEQIHSIIQKQGFSLLYISTNQCSVCKSLLPKIKEMAGHFQNMNFVYVNLDLIPEASGEFSVFSIPGIILYIDGKETIREARYVSVNSLKQNITKYYELYYS